MPGIFLCDLLFHLPNNRKTGLVVPISQKNAAKAEKLHTFVWNHTAKKQQVQASGFLLWISGHGPILRSLQTFTISSKLELMLSRTEDGQC